MSLTEQAMAERMWKEFPALRTILETKKISDHYYGTSSASDTIFEQFQRILKMSILIKENRDSIRESFYAEDQIHRKHLLEDLMRARHALRWAASVFQNATVEIDELNSNR